MDVPGIGVAINPYDGVAALDVVCYVVAVINGEIEVNDTVAVLRVAVCDKWRGGGCCVGLVVERPYIAVARLGGEVCGTGVTNSEVHDDEAVRFVVCRKVRAVGACVCETDLIPDKWKFVATDCGVEIGSLVDL